MTALTAERDTRRRDGRRLTLPLSASKVLAGAIVVMDQATGFAKKGLTATTVMAVGIATETVDNSAGAAGDLSVPIDRDGWFKVANSAAADQITRADIGKTCYLVDDQTVAKTDGGATRAAAGRVRDIDPDGDVWIAFIA